MSSIFYKPPSEALDRTLQLLARQTYLKEALAAIQEEIKSCPQKIADELPSSEDRVFAARYLYWCTTNMPARALAKGLLGSHVNKMLSLVGSMPSGVTCDDCGTEIVATSRSSFPQPIVRTWQPDGNAKMTTLCQPCWFALNKARIAEHNRRYSEMAERQHHEATRAEELRTMPYRDYLQTDEWQARRRKHLRDAGYRCQLCNSDGRLNVHHRTYERRGHELYTDLIVLCEECHDIFHREGKLAG